MNVSPTDMGLLDSEVAEQIDAWKAIEYALDHLDDLYDKATFLRDCTESDMVSIKEDWPDFVAWVSNTK